MKTILPWQLSEEGNAASGVPNLPSPEGAALGAELARLADVAAEGRSVALPERCNDCAARLGTTPNQSAATVMGLLKCAVEGIPFYCHVDEPERLCTGYALLKAGL